MDVLLKSIIQRKAKPKVSMSMMNVAQPDCLREKDLPPRTHPPLQIYGNHSRNRHFGQDGLDKYFERSPENEL